MEAPTRHHSVAEYLAVERQSDIKHEYDDGVITAMAGTTVRHAKMVMNLSIALGYRLRGQPCQPYPSDLRVRLPGSKFVYPDLSIFCGEPETDPEDDWLQTAMNPRVVVEVLSDSTERYDRTRKFDKYRTVETFSEYVLVEQKEPRIEVFYRPREQAETLWLFDVAVGLEAVAQLRSIDVTLPLAEVYERVRCDPPPAEPG